MRFSVRFPLQPFVSQFPRLSNMRAEASRHARGVGRYAARVGRHARTLVVGPGVVNGKPVLA